MCPKPKRIGVARIKTPPSNYEQRPVRCEFKHCKEMVLPKDYNRHLKKAHMVI